MKLFRCSNSVGMEFLIVADTEGDAKRVMAERRRALFRGNVTVEGDETDAALEGPGGESLLAILTAPGMEGVAKYDAATKKWTCDGDEAPQ